MKNTLENPLAGDAVVATDADIQVSKPIERQPKLLPHSHPHALPSLLTNVLMICGKSQLSTNIWSDLSYMVCLKFLNTNGKLSDKKLQRPVKTLGVKLPRFIDFKIRNKYKYKIPYMSALDLPLATPGGSKQCVIYPTIYPLLLYSLGWDWWQTSITRLAKNWYCNSIIISYMGSIHEKGEVNMGLVYSFYPSNKNIYLQQ